MCDSAIWLPSHCAWPVISVFSVFKFLALLFVGNTM